jgi:hypothetical protein
VDRRQIPACVSTDGKVQDMEEVSISEPLSRGRMGVMVYFKEHLAKAPREDSISHRARGDKDKLAI